MQFLFYRRYNIANIACCQKTFCEKTSTAVCSKMSSETWLHTPPFGEEISFKQAELEQITPHAAIPAGSRKNQSWLLRKNKTYISRAWQKSGCTLRQAFFSDRLSKFPNHIVVQGGTERQLRYKTRNRQKGGLESTIHYCSSQSYEISFL